MRYTGLMAVGLVICSAYASSDPGYLPKVGPFPLRFQSVRPMAAVVLPVLKMSDSDPGPSASEQEVSSKAGPGGSSIDTVHLAGSSGASSSAVAAAPPVAGTTHASPAVADTNSIPLVSAQTLMQFITDKTPVSHDPSSLEPPHFTPPVLSVPSSSAVYVSPPPKQ